MNPQGLPTTSIDRVDQLILQQLRQDGRRSFTEMAEFLQLSVSTIRNRYRRMKEEGILHIIGWTDPVKTGDNGYARVMIKVRPSTLLPQVVQQLGPVPEVTFLAHTSGPYDLEANLRCRDNQELIRTIQDKIHVLEGVQDTHTTIYFEVVKWAAVELPIKAG
ncbi:MAG: Lrp/AsnC family transcriptional regulator [Bacteroidota bacterium]